MTRSSKHSAIQEIEILFNGYVLVVNADIIFRFTPGRPATPPSYASGGDPPEGPEINITRVTLTRVTLTRETEEVLECDWLADFVETSLHDDPDKLIEIASEERDAEEDEAAERRYEAMRDDRATGGD